VVNDRDAIRKEKFIVQQPAIEKSLTASDVAELSARDQILIDDPVSAARSINAAESKLLEKAE
jgi:hypothetical protein